MRTLMAIYIRTQLRVESAATADTVVRLQGCVPFQPRH